MSKYNDLIDDATKLNEKELLYFRSHFNIPINDKDCIKAPFYKPIKDSEEVKYIKKRRENFKIYFLSFEQDS